MRIIVSFDTEDFTDPASNDALLRICQTLTARGVHASFGLVGEKARFIRDEGRWDVIDALREHQICYHSDNHFLFPDDRHPLRFASEIVEKCDWDEAVRWLVATEARGLADIEGLFGYRPTTFLRTCGDHAAQMLAAYRQLGLKTFAYYSYQAGDDITAQHISRFCDMVCISLPLVREELTYTGQGPAELDRLAVEGESLINVRFHPCRFIADSWWSLATFAGVPNPRTRPPYEIVEHVAPEETDSRLAYLGALVDYARDRHGATFTTYDEVTDETAKDPVWLTPAQVLEAARAVRRQLSFADVGGVTLTLAESFAAITWANLHLGAEHVPLRKIIGPVELPPTHTASVASSAAEIGEACRAVEDWIACKGRVPDAVSLGGARVAPAAYLRAAAARLLGEQHVQVEPAGPFPDGMDDALRRWDQYDINVLCWFVERERHMPRAALAVKLQYWTYKPVSLSGRA
jgi:hypothetical protein